MRLKKTIRADRLLGNLGYGSRKELGACIRAGDLVVGGRTITDPGAAIPYDRDILRAGTFQGEALDPAAPLTLIVHKPRGYTCSHDEDGQLIYDLLPSRWRRRDPQLSTVGRLDKESTGLVLITDDGDLLHRIIAPKSHVWKSYEVTLRDSLAGDESEIFAAGTMTLKSDDKPLKPARWTPSGDRAGVMALQEGRYHQIRRMFAARGNHVETLHRVRIGGLVLGALAAGEWRILADSELMELFASAESHI